ncbi:MAG: amino acid adenylation domain-containing protein, partial [Desulfobacterales bacterium]|nr:amino acid adenylation domain-containing protein [Desulfobacterales bacterium]
MKQQAEHGRPLTSVQREIWLHQMIHPDIPLYNIGGYLRIRGPVDPVIFEEAIRRLIRENDALRTVIHQGAPLPTQTFARRVSFHLDYHDFSRKKNPGEHAAAWMARRFIHPFRLYGGPLFDYALVKVSGSDYRCLGRYHHIIMDGWGISLVARRLAETYDDLLAGEGPGSPNPSYMDFIDDDAAYLSSEKFAKHERYWLEKFRDLPDSPLARRPRPHADKGSAPGRISHLWVDRAFYNRLGVLARENRASVFHVFLGALYCYFARTAGAEDFVIGLPILNRGSKAFKRTIGLFTSVLSARFRFGVETSFGELTRSIGKELRADYRRQRFPIGEINKFLPVRQQGGGRLFDITLSYEKQDYKPRFNGSPAEAVPLINGFEQNALALAIREFHPDQDVRIDFCYNTDAFNKEEIESLKTRFHLLMKEAVRDPAVLVRDIRIMPEEEYRTVVYRFNDTARDYPKDKTIVDLFEARVEKTPDAMAFLFEDRELSFAELNRRANRLAHRLIHLLADGAAASPPSADAPVIGLFIERGPGMIIGLLGILKAGAAYAPLDPGWPGERLAYMLEDSKAPILLTREKLEDALPGYTGRIIRLDDDGGDLEKQPDVNPAKRTGPDSPAYVIYTSGSTGKPKGVLGCHRGMINRFHWMWETYPFESGEICCQKTSLNFLDSLWEIFGPSLQGVPVVVIHDDVAKDPRRLVKSLEARKVTRVVLVPSLLRVILEQLDETGDALPDMKYWTSSGEALTPGLFNEFTEKRPHDVLINLYGSSETSADSVCFDSRGARPPDCAPIGRPIANTRVYLLDDRLQPVPMGIPGVLYIGGVGLAHGYINRPGLTAVAFAPDPFASDSSSRLYKSGDIARWLPDGNLEYLGRRDHQVKIRGFRVEIGEVEQHLSRIPGVKNAAAAARDFDGDGALELAAYLTSDEPLMADRLRDHLGKSLPDYMIPSYFIPIDAIPLTPSGKTDREALPAPSETIGAGPAAPATPVAPVTPTTPTEDLLATIWRTLLNRERVGPRDHFFHLGGHSLLAARVASRIREAFGLEAPLHVLFEHPTLKELAAWIDSGRREEPPPPVIRAPENAAPPLSFAQERLWFLDQLEGATATYNIPAALKLSGRLDVEALRQSLRTLIQRHDSLRMRFPAKEGRARAR